MRKVCIDCGKLYEEELNFCTDDGGLIVPENVKNKYVKNINIGEWILNFLISMIPLIGIIFVVIWANDEKNKLRKNWAVAQLIWMGILFMLSILICILVFSIIKSKF